MTGLDAIEIKAFVPARDYEVSRRFYVDVGFEEKSEFKGIAYFALGSCSFLLQQFYQQAHADNFMMHLLVDDADGWHRRLTGEDILGRYAAHGVRMSEPGDREWGMRDFHLVDPSGVLWHIGHNTR
ncbi:VOC family protein [Rhodanobacter sp. DHB23]|uniref:VOC family protein n=1 Tax=Rhodanobacter sp. DHB23 TaxID=2775923 RepID=UPI001780D66B|nr:VOC family protein [Rhodanobacter sp. DHB23]MBD8874024.1 VOC family protein [Rhodanobacter sp. DHB23]